VGFKSVDGGKFAEINFLLIVLGDNKFIRFTGIVAADCTILHACRGKGLRCVEMATWQASIISIGNMG